MALTQRRGWTLGLLACVALIGAARWYYGPEVPYSEFLRELDRGTVVEAVIEGDDLSVVARDGRRFTSKVPPGQTGLIDRLLAQNVSVSAKTSDGSSFVGLIVAIAPSLIILAGFVQLAKTLKQSQQGGAAISKSTATRHDFRDRGVRVSFADVAGAEDIKVRLRQVVGYLKEPDRFQHAGVSLKGILLTGPPGTGKTLLAKALANEANVPFFQTSGSGFVELFVGVGASRVRDLFQQAREAAPCVVFIDEIDAIGRKREASSSIGSGAEQLQSLNQLLVELDGFFELKNVVVLAATNRADVLDPALIRPGRFDRTIEVPLPTSSEAQQILAYHLRRRSVSTFADLSELTPSLVGMSGAEIAGLVNEAALSAATRGDSMTHIDLEAAAKRVGVIIPRPDAAYDAVAAVSRRVIGQERALAATAHAFALHFSETRRLIDERGARRHAQPHVFLYGPTGTGKTFVAECFVSVLGGEHPIPFGSVDAVELSYDSRAVDRALQRMLEEAKGDIRRVEQGVLCVSGLQVLVDSADRGLVEWLLNMMRGERYLVSPISSHVHGGVLINTNRMLFCCEATLTAESMPGSAEFGVAQQRERLKTVGFPAKFVEAFSVLESTDTLSAHDLHVIAGDDAVLGLYRARYKERGLELLVEDDALKAIAEAAARRAGGARSLVSLLDDLIREMGQHSTTLTAGFAKSVLARSAPVTDEWIEELLEGTEARPRSSESELDAFPRAHHEKWRTH